VQYDKEYDYQLEQRLTISRLASNHKMSTNLDHGRRHSPLDVGGYGS
jgi:hypothetical protein